MAMKISFSAATIFLFVAVVYLAAFSPLYAHEGATGVVKERMDAMSAMGKAMKTIAELLRGNSVPLPDEAIKASAILRAHSITLPSLFPRGSNGHPSTAKADIWIDWARFVEQSSELKRRSDALADAVEAGDKARMMQTFRGVGAVCSACHRDFRAKN